MRIVGTAIVAAFLAFGGATPATAELTYEEGVCETKAALAAWKYYGTKTGCLVSCQRSVRAGSTDPSECVPPFESSPTFGCIQGKQGRTNGRICSSCNPDAPECYPADICSETASAITDYMDLVLDGGFMPLIYCDESGSPDGLTYLEGKCQDSIAKYIAKAAYSRAKCFAKCRLYELKGVLAPGTCTPPVPGDPYIAACLAKVALATAPRIDRYCGAPYGDAPECLPLTDGGDWVQYIEAQVDAFDGYFYCEN
jgi:hypothetical protein